MDCGGSRVLDLNCGHCSGKLSVDLQILEVMDGRGQGVQPDRSLAGNPELKKS